MTFSKSFILKKLTEIETYRAELEDFLRYPDVEILSDSGKMHIAERLLQLIVDLMLDVNQHIIKEMSLEPAEDFRNTFYILARGKVFPTDFAEKIAPVVGLRNWVVHGYETLDKGLFIKTLRENCEDFNTYVALIQEYLKGE